MTPFRVKFECLGLRTRAWLHRSSMEAFTSIVLDLAAMLFTPEVFCGLKHFTHPSLCIVVGRWVNFHFWVNYPFRLRKHRFTVRGKCHHSPHTVTSYGLVWPPWVECLVTSCLSQREGVPYVNMRLAHVCGGWTTLGQVHICCRYEVGGRGRALSSSPLLTGSNGITFARHDQRGRESVCVCVL